MRHREIVSYTKINLTAKIELDIPPALFAAAVHMLF